MRNNFQVIEISWIFQSCKIRMSPTKAELIWCLSFKWRVKNVVKNQNHLIYLDVWYHVEIDYFSFTFVQISSSHRLRFTLHVTGFNLLKLAVSLINILNWVHFSEIDSLSGIDFFSLITNVSYAYCEKEKGKILEVVKKKLKFPSSKRKSLTLSGVLGREEKRRVIYFFYTSSCVILNFIVAVNLLKS